MYTHTREGVGRREGEREGEESRGRTWLDWSVSHLLPVFQFQNKCIETWLLLAAPLKVQWISVSFVLLSGEGV